MVGYHHDPAATAAILDGGGWLRTGDPGHVEPTGDVVLIGRLKELIKVDAFQVPPAELEALLVQHPSVADAAGVGRPDERHGEVPVALVVPRPGANESFDPDAVLRWVADRVTRHKRLTAVLPVDALPRTPSGKLLRRNLRHGPAASVGAQ